MLGSDLRSILAARRILPLRSPVLDEPTRECRMQGPGTHA